MTNDEFADMAAQESYERAVRAFLQACEVADGEDEPLTDRQRVLVGTALLAQFVGLEDELRQMAHTHDLIHRIAPYVQNPHDGERVPDWFDPGSGEWVHISEEIDEFLASLREDV